MGVNISSFCHKLNLIYIQRLAAIRISSEKTPSEKKYKAMYGSLSHTIVSHGHDEPRSPGFEMLAKSYQETTNLSR